MKKIFALVISLSTCSWLFAQKATIQPPAGGHAPTHKIAADPSSDIWRKLRSLTYEQVNYVYYPKFSEEIKALEGKKVTLKGFIIPLQETTTTTYFMLSYFPFSNCYFCGQAGPETVIEVKAAKPFTYTEKPVTITGTLKLNREDEEHLFYMLEGTIPAE
jgi:hypothetical protein